MLQSLNKNFKNLSRFDHNLLTGLLTIKDSSFDGISINIGGMQEDGLNLIRTKGEINLISINDSFQDAIDFDFSDISVENIYVKNVGNDCIDLSSGNYYIENLRSNNCFDKGVSVGESSNVIINNIYQSGSNISLVLKDSSSLIVNKSDLSNYNYCAASYRKTGVWWGINFYPKKYMPYEQIAHTNQFRNYIEVIPRIEQKIN